MALDYAPGSVGCCTMGFVGLQESVLLVVVEAAPSSRVKARIHAIMVFPPALPLPFPHARQEVRPKKTWGMPDLGSRNAKDRLHLMRKFDPPASPISRLPRLHRLIHIYPEGERKQIGTMH